MLGLIVAFTLLVRHRKIACLIELVREVKALILAYLVDIWRYLCCKILSIVCTDNPAGLNLAAIIIHLSLVFEMICRKAIKRAVSKNFLAQEGHLSKKINSPLCERRSCENESITSNGAQCRNAFCALAVIAFDVRRLINDDKAFLCYHCLVR